MRQRTKKSNSNNTTWFIYDENDNVIAEYDGVGNLIYEYIYLNDAPIGLIRNSNLYYIYTDHLNTPRAITDINNNLKWTWKNKEAFGNNQPDENVSGTQFKFNLRFPGQYFDIETNLNYNINRDYNSVWGRYVQSDPLGLSAGLNTYGYAGANALVGFDRLGLFTQYLMAPAIGAAIGGGLGYSQDGLSGLKRGLIQGGITGLGVVGAGKLVGMVARDSILTQVSANVIGATLGEVTGQFFSNQSCNFDWALVGVAATSGLIISPIFKPYILKNQTVTSWAKNGISPDLNSGRWVMMGNDNYLNYGLSGALHNNKNNYISGTIKGERLQYPNGLESFKGLIGQRVVK